MLADYYTPKAAMPMVRKIYPKMMKASDIDIMGEGKIRDKVWDYEVDGLRGCTFLSRSRIKKCLKGWKPFKNGRIHIVVVEYDGFEPRWKTMERFRFPDKKDDFMVELANLSDLHGIIKMSAGSIWFRKVNDPKDLNIDATTMDRISSKLGLEERML